MKKLLLTLALGATLTSGALAPAAFAQGGPPPASTGAPAAPAFDHDKMKAAMEQLGLSPRQKMQCAKILRAAKDSNQDKATTMKQLSGVLTPEQHAKLKTMMAEKVQQNKTAPK